MRRNFIFASVIICFSRKISFRCLLGQYFSKFLITNCSNYHSSNSELLQLISKDVDFSQRLSSLKKKYPLVKDTLRGYPEIQAVLKNRIITKSARSNEVIIGNPLNQFYTLHKFSTQWPKAVQKLSRASAEILRLSAESDEPNPQLSEIVAKLLGLSREISLVEVEIIEVKRAAQSILRLQEFYHLDAGDILQGRIENYSAARPMTEDEARLTILAAFTKADFCRVTQWGQQFPSLGFSIPDLVEPVLRKRKPPTRSQCASMQCFSGGSGKSYCTGKDDVTNKYQQTCNQRYFSTLDKSKPRYPPCFLHASHPALILQPTRVEWVSLNPPIYMFHSIFTPQECDQFWRVGRSEEQEGGSGSDDSRESGARGGTNEWLSDSFDEVYLFTKRVSQSTGLSADSESEDWQASSYGLGGHYWFHYDYFSDHTSLDHDSFSSMGNRLATFMVYLSDVYFGGATAFPLLGKSFQPKKGSALFWFNLDLAGAPLPYTLHGGCAVGVGTKRIGNKWVRYNGQFNTFPCGLKREKQTPKLPKSLVKF
ncbi:prolyl 4-hydroxylase subunit alpha-1-like [Symsagittifera roscoffensis]|uniref:prolyl 4-hydroxylase subunit alpha-1-like n=1 Tax=Symsagittifera roscoffensis TaxID=84072 RepID=UPI00307B70AD